MHKIKIKLGKDGAVKVEAEGYKGGTCEQATEFIKKLFGEEENKSFKPSYYEDDETQTNIGTDGLPSGWCG